MDVRLSEDEHLLREQVRRVADEAAPLSGLLARGEEEDKKLLSLALSLGWTDPDELTLPQRVILLQESGRALFPDALHTFLAARTVAQSVALVAGNSSGLRDATSAAELGLAFMGADGARTGLSLTTREGESHLSGVASFVPNYDACERLLVLAHNETDNMPAVAVVDAAQAAQVTTFDGLGGRPLSRPSWNEARVVTSFSAIEAESAFMAAVVLAEVADMAGMLRRMLDIGVDHALNRVQFGRPIGSFQAIQHRLADAALAADGAELWSFRIATMIDSGNVHPAYIRAGFSWVRAAAAELEATVHQVTAGVGFTVEHPLHRFFWRLKARSQSTRFAVNAWAGPATAAAFGDGPFASYVFDPPSATIAAHSSEVQWNVIAPVWRRSSPV